MELRTLARKAGLAPRPLQGMPASRIQDKTKRTIVALALNMANTHDLQNTGIQRAKANGHRAVGKLTRVTHGHPVLSRSSSLSSMSRETAVSKTPGITTKSLIP